MVTVRDGGSRDPRGVPPVQIRRTSGVEVLWLLESDQRALALVADADAARLWRHIVVAGRRFGICPVGEEALARYALVDGRRWTMPARPTPSCRSWERSG